MRQHNALINSVFFFKYGLTFAFYVQLNDVVSMEQR